MNDLVYGVKLTGDGKQLVGEVRASREEFDKLGASAQRVAQQTKSYWAEQQQAANASAASWLKGNAAADAAADKAWALANGYKEVGGQVLKAGTESAKGIGDLGLNTQYARRELMQLGKEAVTGDFSRMPKTFASLVTHSNLLPALFTPIGAAVAAVTVAAAAGATAWYLWGKSAREAAAEAKAAMETDAAEAARLAESSKRMTTQEQIEGNQREIARLKRDVAIAQEPGNIPTMAEVLATTRYTSGGPAVDDDLFKKRETNSKKLRDNLITIANLERNNLDFQKQIDDAASRRDEKDARSFLRKESEMERAAKKRANETAGFEADAFKAQMDAMGVAAEQTKVYQMAMRGVEPDLIAVAQAAADIKIALDAQAKASKESVAAWDESSKAVDKARTASAEYVNQLQFENSLLGKNALDVQVLTEKRRIDLVLEKELLALRNNDKFKARNSNPEVDAAYQAAVKGATDAADAARKGADIELVARDQVTRSWEFGSSEAIRKYNDQVRNSAAQAESLYTKAFKSAEDAVTKFAMTGKLNIRDFAQTVIEEFVRINVSRPMVSAGSGMLGDLLGVVIGSMAGTPAAGGGGGQMAAPGSANDVLAMMGAAFGPGRASGGEVYPNTLHPVNERGPELLNYGGSDYLMMGGRGGYVKPLTSAGGGAPSSSGYGQSLSTKVIVNVIEAPGKGGQQQQRNEGGTKVIDVFIEQIKSAIAGDISRGSGAVPAAMAQSYGLNRVAGSY